MSDQFADFGAADASEAAELHELFGSTLTTSEEDARTRARLLVEFADGLDDAGQVETARRARVTARDLLETLDTLDAVRGQLDAMRRDRDRWREDRWREAHAEAWPK